MLLTIASGKRVPHISQCVLPDILLNLQMRFGQSISFWQGDKVITEEIYCG